jgi:hypothetical protein
VYENFQTDAVSHGRYASGVWSSPRGLGLGGLPRVTVDASGRSHVVWCRNFDVVYTFGDGTGVFPVAETVATDPDCGGPPGIALRSDGLPLVVWEGWNGVDVQVYQSVRGAMGTWSPPEDISQSTPGNGDNPALAADAVGNLHLLWAEYHGGGDLEVFYSMLPEGFSTAFMQLTPANWNMVLSLRPTFAWVDPGPVDQYILRAYLATGDPDNPTAGRVVQESTLIPSWVSCDGEECFFKPRIPEGSPSDDEFELSSLLVEVADPFNHFDPRTQSPENINLLGYLWELEVHSDSRVTLSELAYFQIPPLGTWSNVKASSIGPCSASEYRHYCDDVSYQGGYWSYYDDSFYRWGELFDVPPQLLKAIAYGETNSSLGPQLIGNFPPHRAYLYEPSRDFYGKGNCKDSCRDYRVRGDYDPVITPYDDTIPAGTSIHELVAEPPLRGYVNRPGFGQIPGCGGVDYDEAECRENTAVDAEWSAYASYGLGQVLFYASWSIVEAVNGEILPPPEDLYDPDQGVRGSAAVLGLAARCRNVVYEEPYPHANSDFSLWATDVGARYGGGANPARVGGRLVLTNPVSPLGRGIWLYEIGQWDQVEEIVRLLANPSYGFCESGSTARPFRDELNAYLRNAGVIAESAHRPVLAAVAQQAGGGRELDRVAVDFDRDGVAEAVAVLQLVVPAEGVAPGRIQILDAAQESSVLWTSPPLAPYFLSSAFAYVVENGATGQVTVMSDWFEGLHGSRTYFVEPIAGSFRVVPVIGADGQPQDGVFSNGGGTTLSADGSILSLQTTEQLLSRQVDAYIYTGDGYEFARSYIHDWSVPDTTPPSSTIEPAPIAGWWTAPVHVTLTAHDDQGVAGIEYSLVNGIGGLTAFSPPLEVVEFTLEEGRWALFRSARDLSGNAELPQPALFLIDGTPPITQAVLEGEQADGAFSSAVTVELQASDPVLGDGSTGSGVARIEYSLDGGATWLEYIAPFLVEGSGPHEVLHRASDAAGNLGTPEAAAFEIVEIVVDEAPPVLSVDAYPQSLWPPNGKEVAVTVGIEASDAESGLGRLTVWIEDEYDQHEPPLAPIVLSGEPTVELDVVVGLVASRLGSDTDGRIYRIMVQVEDMAGNASVASVTVLVPHDQGKSKKK